MWLRDSLCQHSQRRVRRLSGVPETAQCVCALRVIHTHASNVHTASLNQWIRLGAPVQAMRRKPLSEAWSSMFRIALAMMESHKRTKDTMRRFSVRRAAAIAYVSSSLRVRGNCTVRTGCAGVPLTFCFVDRCEGEALLRPILHSSQDFSAAQNLSADRTVSPIDCWCKLSGSQQHKRTARCPEHHRPRRP